MLAHCKELMEYQTGVFGAVERGQMLERVCKRELIDSMSRFAWNNNLRRSSKLVIINLAFLGAVSAVGFIFLWNATDSIVINDDTGKTQLNYRKFLYGICANGTRFDRNRIEYYVRTGH